MIAISDTVIYHMALKENCPELADAIEQMFNKDGYHLMNDGWTKITIHNGIRCIYDVGKEGNL